MYINLYLCQCRGKEPEYAPNHQQTNYLRDKKVKMCLIEKGSSPFTLHISEFINLFIENISMYYVQ